MDPNQNGASGARPNSQVFNLPSAALQNQIHELAKTLPPPRKQNTACDACRARKVKCHQLPGLDKCQHCLSKNYPCTHHIQQATSEKKRHAAASKRPRTLSASHTNPSFTAPGPSRHTSDPSVPHSSPPTSYQTQTAPRSSPGVYPQQHPITAQTPTKDVLAYLFSPPDSSSPTGCTNGSLANSRAYGASGQAHMSGGYADWGELAARLVDEAFRIEFALDLVEVFFQIVHTRLPLLNPAQFRARLQLSLYSPTAYREHLSQSPTGTSSSHSPKGAANKPIHPGLVATVMAWGAKFSEHPLLLADRERNANQSIFAKTLLYRTRSLAEDLKVHRIPSADHVVIALLIEPLQSQRLDESDGFHGFWLMSAIRLLLDLQINHKSVMSNIEDPEARGTMIFAWWMACLSDAYRSVYYRRKPMLDDDDYDIDFYTVGPVPPDIIESHAPQPSPREQLEFLGYYRAAHALARIARQMSRQLWRPATESDGIPHDVLRNIMTQLVDWREEYLQHVGVPSNFEAEWDFVSAVSACASDATYHIMWIILFNALDDFGVREINDLARAGSPEMLLPNHSQIESTKKQVMEEALHGALRIAGLAGVLTTNGYLRLDCAVMHVSCIQAGELLARFGRPEASNCIDGLNQYSYAYEECAEQAANIKRMYTQATSGEAEFNHMASVVTRDPAQAGSDMNIDHPFTYRA
ncbi:hypothetical protein OBBRIDRAFT_795009 [Obba rivulosa]|uniref:Zn(2)-C6 fungal-type domain-containing protein n=1 Tax=Obba rivulosa TaxID=1052685 RepID=A0A8E2DKB0_9APHY|nr:hypothetical protein OBBRIDRAFT_795009 [Obba rivulosa]